MFVVYVLTRTLTRLHDRHLVTQMLPALCFVNALLIFGLAAVSVGLEDPMVRENCHLDIDSTCVHALYHSCSALEYDTASVRNQRVLTTRLQPRRAPTDMIYQSVSLFSMYNPFFIHDLKV